jgi:uncharacterized membrane protein HdeD (DUF308 family)
MSRQRQTGDEPVLIERTSKRWKLMQLLGIIALVTGLIFFAVLGEDTRHPSLFAGIVGWTLVGGGAVIIIVGSTLAWWHHG